MEEGVPPPTTTDDGDDLSLSPLGHCPGATTNDSLSSPSRMVAPQIIPPLNPPPEKQLDTYVVQIPKDQIYRVPPPENALIMEHHRLTKRQKKSILATKRCRLFMLLLIIALILGLVAGGLYFFIFFPQTPKFSVSNFVVKIPKVSTRKGATPNYDISIKVENMNERMSVDYDSDDGSSSSSKLSFKREDIAFGWFPAFHEESKEVKEVSVKLAGVEKGLPPDIEKRFHRENSTSPMLLDLKMQVVVKASVWLIKVSNTKLQVSCKLKVSTLDEGVRVLFQDCETDSSQQREKHVL